ncbi:RxLR effector protein [Phytophthora megakarya]|uniref:RxLR effector protein n=1 Tax=Phytophthora megakarya TaxID=4795 RepID=A0A225UJ09_9STRA|nr:RxLR effector protein [Phytophthora megakarya]
MLRAQQKTDETIDSDDEERESAKLVEEYCMKLARAERVKYKQMVKTVQAQDLNNLDEAVNNLMKQGINHDQVYAALKLGKEKNQWMSMNRDSPFYHKRSPKYKLWEQLREAVLHQRANS